jgi:hypothetical protein
MAKQFTPTRALWVVSAIFIPVMAFAGSLAGQVVVSQRTISLQSFNAATNIITSDTALKNEQLKVWAEMVIQNYTQGAAKDPGWYTSDRFFLVSKEIADNICLFPRDQSNGQYGFGDPKGPYLMDTLRDDSKTIVGKDVRVLLAHAIADYNLLEGQYESTLKILNETCGFLKKISAEEDWRPFSSK